MTTNHAARMAEVVTNHAPFLKETGFRKRRHSFNRPAADGLVHVVHFWMHPKEPPAWTEVPGLRERRYGTFRLDFGVYVPEMTRSHVPKGSWINDYDCHLRRTIGQLLGAPSDLWWSLDEAEVSKRAGEALIKFGLPWLDLFPNRDALIDVFERKGGVAIGMSPAAALDFADLFRSIGRTDDERRTLEKYLNSPVNPGHAKYLSEYLRNHGYDELMSRIQIA